MKRLISILLISTWSILSFAQDIHLSQIYASPTLVNPAMNGLFEGDIRFIVNARSQWNTITNAYKTVIASADMKTVGLGRRDYLATGIQVYSDRAGDLGFNINSASLALSYLRSLDGKGNTFLSYGMQANYVSNRVDYNKIVAYDQIAALNNGSYQNNFQYWDLSTGLAWYQKLNRNNSYFIGASIFHLNGANVSFAYRTDVDQKHNLHKKFTIHGGGTFRLADGFDIKPNFIFMDQGPNREISFGSYARIRTQYNNKRKPLNYFYLGGWLRWHAEKDLAGVDAFIGSIRFDYRTFYVAFSYDFNISKWIVASQTRGGSEISIIKILDLDRDIPRNSKVVCPANF